MKWLHSLGLTVVLSCAAFQPVRAATNFWQDVDTHYQARVVGDTPLTNVLVKKGRRLTASLSEMRQVFSSSSGVVISIPLPDGTMTSYQFSRSSVMPDELAAKYPEIQTFKATDITDPSNRGSFDITPQGFHGMFQHEGKWVFIDPENRNDAGNYVAYYGINALPLESRPQDQVINEGLLSTNVTADSLYSSRPLIGTNLRTYRLAVAATAEYTAFHGGKDQAIAAINTLISRVNEVYERDLSIRFQLVVNNDNIVYTNRFTDPYSNSDDDAETNATSLPTVIPNSSFDIGHVLNTGGGGVAFLSGVCRDGSKSIGMTGISNPTGDAFYIDYVAHELGHQLGANHTFNGTSSACGNGNRESANAWEPGSGSTIMGYAGICGMQDLQANSDPHFHTGSIQEMLETTESAGCGTLTATQNTIPIADAGDDFTIPANMPFTLVGFGSDEDADNLSYIWEQYDTGNASSGLSTMVDDSTRPLFRSLQPSASPERTLPNIVDYTSGTLQVGETMPITSRDLNFRLTVRDGKGGVATDEMKVTVVAGGSTFQITEPLEDDVLEPGASAFIRWDVAGTDLATIGCSAVDLLMSENGDEVFDLIIVQGAPNDGVHAYTVSASTTSDAVIMLRCSTSGFFALSSDKVTAAPSGTDTGGTDTGTSDSGGGSFSVNALTIGLLLVLMGFSRRFRFKALEQKQ